jgi:site-specific recombinase XerD
MKLPDPYLKSIQAGLSEKGYSLHCLRHTFASELLSAGMPLESLKHLLGHRSIVYFSNDTYEAVKDYLKIRPSTRVKRLFLVEKGLHKGKPLSIRGIQHRFKYYARKTGVNLTCHRLRHTMATQLLNADAMLVSVQELLGHNSIISTQRYCKVSNEKVRRDYCKALELVMRQS